MIYDNKIEKRIADRSVVVKISILRGYIMNIKEHNKLIDSVVLLLIWKLIDRKTYNEIVSSTNEMYKYCKT